MAFPIEIPEIFVPKEVKELAKKVEELKKFRDKYFEKARIMVRHWNANVSNLESRVGRLMGAIDAYSAVAQKLSSTFSALASALGNLEYADFSKAKCKAPAAMEKAGAIKGEKGMLWELAQITWRMMCMYDCLKKGWVIPAADYALAIGNGLAYFTGHMIEFMMAFSELSGTLDALRSVTQNTVDEIKGLGEAMSKLLRDLSQDLVDVMNELVPPNMRTVMRVPRFRKIEMKVSFKKPKPPSAAKITLPKGTVPVRPPGAGGPSVPGIKPPWMK